MSWEKGKCPNCTGTMILDASKEKVVCMYCQHEIVIKDAIQKVTVDGIAPFDAILMSAQEALEYERDFDKARKKFREALNLSPNDYRVLWGLYLCEIESIKWARNLKGYVQFPNDISKNVQEVTYKYGKRAYENAPDDVKPLFYKIIQTNIDTIVDVVEKKKKGCYIATCIYNSYDCPQVWLLRRYRDYYLENRWWGRLFVRIYYLTSPMVVKIFGKMSWFRSTVKKLLDKKIAKLESKGYENTPYEDK